MSEQQENMPVQANGGNNPALSSATQDSANEPTNMTYPEPPSNVRPENAHWYGQVNSGPPAPPGTPLENARSNEQPNGESSPAPGISQRTVHWYEQSGPASRTSGIPPQEPTPEPVPGTHRIVIEFQPPPPHAPVVLSEHHASNRGVHNGSDHGCNVSLTEGSQNAEQSRNSELSRTPEHPNSPESPQSPELSRSPDEITFFLPICSSPSPSPENDTKPPEPAPSPPTALQNVDEPIWHEYETVLTPEAIECQKSLLSNWNSAAYLEKRRAAEERAHLKAVELESELLSDREKQGRRERRKERQRQRQRDGDNVSRSTISLVSGLLERLRGGGDSKAEDQPQNHTQTQTHQQPQARSETSLNLHRITRFAFPAVSSSSAAAPSVSTSRPLTTTHPSASSSSRTRTYPRSCLRTNTAQSKSAPALSEHPAIASSSSDEQICAICGKNPGTLIQGPQSRSFYDMVPCPCCQGCLDEILEAEMQTREGEEKE